MKYSIITFGCRVNQADSLRLEEDLRARGATPASPAAADVVVVNSCSVTATADQGTRQTIRRVARENPSARIVVTGCYATREHDQVAALPNVACVVRNPEKERLADLLAGEDGLTTGGRFAGEGGPCGSPLLPGDAGRTVFFLRVQTGCEETCSFCIIPTTRGRGISLPQREVVERVSRAVRSGYKEVVLAGVHLGSYGRDLPERASLLSLAHALDRLPGDVRFRISSLEPRDCPGELIRLVAASGRFAPHFHLPLQHASSRMLRLMQRPYTLDEYRALVDAIRDAMPHAAIGSDTIVGFPGETDRDAEELRAYLASSPLTSLHVFAYSDRPGTVATAMSGKVNGQTIRARSALIREVGRVLSERFLAQNDGTVHRAVTLDDGTLALTDNYIKVRIPPGRQRNEWVDVRLRKAPTGLIGEPVAERLQGKGLGLLA